MQALAESENHLMPNTTETAERLARLETNYEHLTEQVDGIHADVRKLLQAANMGQGAWWLLLRLGGFLVVLAGAGAWLWDHSPWGKG